MYRFLHLEGSGSGSGGARAPCHNKGFARRPQEFLAWEVGGRKYRFLYLQAGRWEAVCRDSCMWRWWEWGSRKKEDLEPVGAAHRIKVSHGAHRSSWPGRWEAVCRDSCMCM